MRKARSPQRAHERTPPFAEDVPGGGWRVTDAVVERDPERYRSSGDAEDRRLLELVLDIVVRHER